MDSRLFAEIWVIWVTLKAVKLPSIDPRFPKSRLSVVSVATTMFPENVGQPPIADASPAFWMVVVGASHCAKETVSSRMAHVIKVWGQRIHPVLVT